MTELDDVINDSGDEIHAMTSKRVKRVKLDHKNPASFKMPILIVSAVVVAIQWNGLSTWIFGIPDDTVQADIIELLQSADNQVQNVFLSTGAVPEQLPASIPSWLVGYKKTLAGYKIDSEINGVRVELERTGEIVSINQKE